MTETTPGAPVEPTGPEMGAFGKLSNVLFSPSRVFESVARKPGWDWLVPIVILLAASFFVQTVLASRIDVDEAVRAQIKMMEKMQGGEVPAEAREKIEEAVRGQVEAGMKPARRLIAFPIIFAVIFLVAGIYKGIAAAFGVPARYMALVAGYAWVQIPAAIYQFLTGLVALPRDKIFIYDVQFLRVLKSNVGAMLPWETTHKAVLALLSSVDVFDIWAFILGSVMISKTTGFSKKGARWVVGGVWGVYILIKVVLGFVMQAFAS